MSTARLDSYSVAHMCQRWLGEGYEVQPCNPDGSLWMIYKLRKHLPGVLIAGPLSVGSLIEKAHELAPRKSLRAKGRVSV